MTYRTWTATEAIEITRRSANIWLNLFPHRPSELIHTVQKVAPIVYSRR